MAISFNNIPDTIRTPGTYVEIDNSRALKGLAANPHKVLILGQKIAAGTAPAETVMQVTSDGLANGFFGNGSILARMCNVFKKNNPNTELHAMCLSVTGGTAATGTLKFASSFSATATAVFYLMINGTKVYTTITSGWSVTDVCSAIKTNVNANSQLPVIASKSASAAGSDHIAFIAVNSGTMGNYIDIRWNYYAGQSNPAPWSVAALSMASVMGAGATDPDLGDAWAVVDGIQYQYIIQPYIVAANLVEVEDELESRFGPMIDLQGQGFTAVRATQASATTLGNSRNSPHNCIMAAYDSPTCPEEWAAALGAVASYNLNQDPARPLHYLKLKGILAPPVANRFSRSERDLLLYDGIATFITDTSDNVLIERCITTYQTNSAGLTDASYLDVQTLATLNEIRYQFKNRMVSRFIIPRFKLADDTFPVQPGTYIATPKTVKQEVIALFAELSDAGLIENLSDFIENVLVERDASDVNRVNVLLPPDLVNQFLILAGQIQFIL